MTTQTRGVGMQDLRQSNGRRLLYSYFQFTCCSAKQAPETLPSGREETVHTGLKCTVQIYAVGELEGKLGGIEQIDKTGRLPPQLDEIINDTREGPTCFNMDTFVHQAWCTDHKDAEGLD